MITTISKRKINEAGLFTREHQSPETPEFDEALDILGQWRDSHVHPLQVTYMALRERSRKVDSKALVSQRLKRIPSIITKLQRNRAMKLTTIQDIGGCRAVVEDLKILRKVARKYETLVKDYISEPKSDGYRGLHFVEQYRPSAQKHETSAGRRIEIQLRTKLQHQWATAVETVDSLLGENLKAGAGHEDWKRFFSLASCVIAKMEGSALIPGTPNDEKRLKNELKRIAEKLDVFKKLEGLASSVEKIPTLERSRNIGYYVLQLNLKERVIRPHPFRASDDAGAAAYYLHLEKENYGNPSVQVVQVSVSQLKDLKRAFPNYYLNATAFVDTIQSAIA